VTLALPCFILWNSLCIRPDGKISLCCQDVYGKYTLGDVSNNTLHEIWHSKELNNLREKLKVGRDGLALCEHCDMFQPNMYNIG